MPLLCQPATLRVQVNGGTARTGSPPSTFPRTVTAAPTITSVLNGASFQPGIASGTWITVEGSNLAPLTPNGRTWTSSDFNGNLLPTSLDQVSVTVNSQSAYIYYISPTQINALAPGDSALGSVPVQVTTSNGVSNVLSATKQSVSPAIFTYTQNSRYGIATVGSVLIGPAGLVTPSMRPTVPGEIVTLWVTGLGETTPAYPEGQIISQPAPLASTVQATIGGAPATVQYAGISSPGLYQINVTVPSLLAGDAAVLITVNGIQSAAQAFIPVGAAVSPGVLNETTINVTATIADCYTAPPPYTATASFVLNLPESLAPQNVNSGSLVAEHRVTIPAIAEYACVTFGQPLTVIVSATYDPGFQSAAFLLTMQVDYSGGATGGPFSPLGYIFEAGAAGVTLTATQVQLQTFPPAATTGALLW